MRPGRWKHAALLSIAALLAGCHNAPTQTAFGNKTTTLRIGDNQLVVEVAESPEQLQTGLMFRDSLGEDQGMLFVFEEPKQASFWMKNTKIPLSIAFLGPDRQILEIHSLRPLDETVLHSDSARVAYALEVNEGWFARHRVQPGMQVQYRRTQ